MGSLINNIKRHGMDGGCLKLVAIVTMMIDHIGASIMMNLINERPCGNFEETIYLILRIIGRISFPIFIFLLIEGFVHTRSRLKYLLRLSLFAIVSEIPFDLAFNIPLEETISGKIVEFDSQNVFFTLAFGFFAILIMDYILENNKNKEIVISFCVFLTLFMMLLSELISSDYGMGGVLTIVLAYLFRKNAKKELVAICTTLTLFCGALEIFTFLSYFLISSYNGKKGINLKWIFYIFYPAHLLILWGIMLVVI